MATLHLVSTPIGNLEDISHRAVRILGEASRILCEDTRRTAVLCRRWAITTPRVSLHAHNEAERTVAVLRWLDDGQTLALVSDAGTPLLCDPGLRLVRAVLDAGHDVSPVPGASALLAALVASGLDPQPFAFFGFPPRAGRDRTALLQRLAQLDMTAVLYESPNRLTGLLRDLVSVCGGGRAVTVARELTKLHETFVRGTLAETLAYYETTGVRGEVVVVLGGREGEPREEVDAGSVARRLLAQGGRPSDVARELARRLGLPRNEAYDIALAAAARGDGDEQ
jgi:16S rRNA (cytidine1402-2'-O)-methyltransferase